MPFQLSQYPKNWKQISLACRERAGWKCERCGAKQGDLTERSKRLGLPRKVVLTAAHTGPHKHNKADCSHLEALCQRCHLKEDMADHVRHAHETRRRKKEAAGQLVLMDSSKVFDEKQWMQRMTERITKEHLLCDSCQKAPATDFDGICFLCEECLKQIHPLTKGR